MREALDDAPSDLRVAVAASGGLWHTPGMPGAWLNSEFDRAILDRLAEGDARGMADYFDSYVIPEDDTSQDAAYRGRVSTGMPSPGGPAFGTRETCAWIAAGRRHRGPSHHHRRLHRGLRLAGGERVRLLRRRVRGHGRVRDVQGLTSVRWPYDRRGVESPASSRVVSLRSRYSHGVFQLAFAQLTCRIRIIAGQFSHLRSTCYLDGMCRAWD